MTKRQQKLLGQEIRAARDAAGMAQAQVSRHTGLDQSQISRLERGKCAPSVGQLIALCDALDCEFTITRKTVVLAAPKAKAKKRRR